jgi:nucleotide-binding universal stress UspA family protein
VDFQEHPSRTELSRSLLAADAGIDPHRLVTLCCEHAGDDPLSVSLVIPVEDTSRPWSESTAAAERLLHKADVLLGAAGVRLEEVVISDGAGQELGDLVRSGGFDALLICPGATSSTVLPLAARLARAHGLAVVESPDPPGHTGWLRRLVGSLTHRPSL